ncbi:MAG: head fiber protein [Eubacteriales bacterium]
MKETGTIRATLCPEGTLRGAIAVPRMVSADDAVLYTAQSLTDAQKAQARANIGAGTPYTLPEASPDALGGIKADATEETDTQPVRIGEDGKLYTAPGGGADISLGISGASSGQVAKIKAVDESGAPTAWEAGDASSGGSEWRLIHDVTIEEDVTSVYISDDEDGNPFSLKKIACVIYSDGGTGMTSTAYMKCAFNTSSMTENRFLDIKDVFKPYGSHCALIFVTNFDGPFVYTEYIKYADNVKPFDDAGNPVFNYQSGSTTGLVNAVAPAERLTSLLIYNDSSATFRAGSRIQLYGVKA